MFDDRMLTLAGTRDDAPRCFFSEVTRVFTGRIALNFLYHPAHPFDVLSENFKALTP